AGVGRSGLLTRCVPSLHLRGTNVAGVILELRRRRRDPLRRTRRLDRRLLPVGVRRVRVLQLVLQALHALLELDHALAEVAAHLRQEAAEQQDTQDRNHDQLRRTQVEQRKQRIHGDSPLSDLEALQAAGVSQRGRTALPGYVIRTLCTCTKYSKPATNYTSKKRRAAATFGPRGAFCARGQRRNEPARSPSTSFRPPWNSFTALPTERAMSGRRLPKSNTATMARTTTSDGPRPNTANMDRSPAMRSRGGSALEGLEQQRPAGSSGRMDIENIPGHHPPRQAGIGIFFPTGDHQ